MMPMIAFKICRCCGTKVGARKRVCPYCRVPALWRAPTEAEIAETAAALERSEQLLQELLGKGADHADR
jgi:hypothetical protein